MNEPKHDAEFSNKFNWKILVKFTRFSGLFTSREMFNACKTWEDVVNCADMGDFKIVGYDLPTSS